MSSTVALSGWDDTARLVIEGGLLGIPCSLFRAGTSKGPVFFASDLPGDGALRNRLLLAALNPDHPGQIDGIGGPETLSNKVAIVSPSQHPQADVDYKFIQLTPGSATVNDDCGTSGNMAAAIGPFAIEGGLVRPCERETAVRIFAVDSRMLITASVQSPGGNLTYEGSTAIAGVGGTAAPVLLTYHPPFGTLCGALLPTGHRRDVVGGLPVTVIDAAGEVAMIFRAGAVGRTGYETKAELDRDDALAAQIEPLRQAIARRIGLDDVAASPTPAAIMVAPPRAGGAITSRKLTTAAGAPARCHAAHSGSGGICLAIAATMCGTVAAEVARPREIDRRWDVLIEHPSGKMSVSVEPAASHADDSPAGVSLVRTCRKLFSGRVHVPLSALT